jgi:AraC-like DNA-binding protein
MKDTFFSDTLNEELLSLYLKKQEDERFRRIVDGDYELVDYLPGSSMRIWLNNESCDYSLHWHPAIEIIMPLENMYTVNVRQMEYRLEPGDILMIPEGELHHLSAPPAGIRLIFLFDLSVLSKIKGFSYLTTYLSQPSLITKATHEILYDKASTLLLKMCRTYYSTDNLRELSIYAMLLEFFASFGRYRMSETKQTPDEKDNLRHKDLLEKLNKSFEYLDSHFTESLTLEKVAAAAGFSKFHFSRMFKQCSGYNFYDYLCYRRIKAAEGMLMNPAMSITETALQSGFCSLSTFNRTFRRMKNCTPTEYRNLYSSAMHEG